MWTFSDHDISESVLLVEADLTSDPHAASSSDGPAPPAPAAVVMKVEQPMWNKWVLTKKPEDDHVMKREREYVDTSSDECGYSAHRQKKRQQPVNLSALRLLAELQLLIHAKMFTVVNLLCFI